MKTVPFIFTLLILSHLVSFSQSSDSLTGRKDFIVVEKAPKPLNMQEFLEASAYPGKAKRKGIEGTVMIRVLASEEGSYVKHVVLNREIMDPFLVEACESHIPMIKFSQAIDTNGVPIQFWVNIPIAYKLNVADTEYSVGQLMEFGVKSYYQGNYEAGLTIAKRLILEHDQYAGAYILKGACLYQRNPSNGKASFSSAFRILKQLEKAKPSWGYQMTRGVISTEEIIRQIQDKTTERSLLETLGQLLSQLAYVEEDWSWEAE